MTHKSDLELVVLNLFCLDLCDTRRLRKDKCLLEINFKVVKEIQRNKKLSTDLRNIPVSVPMRCQVPEIELIAFSQFDNIVHDVLIWKFSHSCRADMRVATVVDAFDHFQKCLCHLDLMKEKSIAAMGKFR